MWFVDYSDCWQLVWSQFLVIEFDELMNISVYIHLNAPINNHLNQQIIILDFIFFLATAYTTTIQRFICGERDGKRLESLYLVDWSGTKVMMASLMTVGPYLRWWCIRVTAVEVAAPWSARQLWGWTRTRVFGASALTSAWCRGSGCRRSARWPFRLDKNQPI